MTEKRADYQRKHNKSKSFSLLTDFFRKDKKSQEFNKEDYEAGINQDVNSPEYQRNPELTREEKIDQLKKRLNIAIGIVLGLLVLVFVALFKL